MPCLVASYFILIVPAPTFLNSRIPFDLASFVTAHVQIRIEKAESALNVDISMLLVVISVTLIQYMYTIGMQG